MWFLRKPVFWVGFLILVNLALAIFIFKPSFIKNSPSTFDTKKAVEKKIVKSKPGSCKFLIEEYCDKGHLEEVDIGGKKYKVVGFRLPAGIEIFTPFDTQVEGVTLEDFQWKGYAVIIQSEEDKSESIRLIGDSELIGGRSRKFMKGDEVATIKNNGITNINNYNLLILMTKENEHKELETNAKMLEAYFPKL